VIIHTLIKCSPMTSVSEVDVEMGCEMQEGENDDTGVCAVCMETYDSEASIMNYHCGHFFHVDCTREWVCTQFKNNVDLTCPVCRFVQCHTRSPYYRRLRREMGVVIETNQQTINAFNVEQAHSIYIQQARQQQQRFIQNQRRPSQFAQHILGFVMCGIMVLLTVFVIILFKALTQNE